MQNNKKKERERLFLREIVEICPNLFEGSIIDFEEPDFIVETNQTHIGIELTDYIYGQNDNGSLYLKNEKFWERATKKARSIFESGNSTPLNVHVIWNPKVNPMDKDEPEIADILASLINQNILLRQTATIMGDDDSLDNTALDGLILLISFQNAEKSELASWVATPLARFTDLQVSEIQSIINNKEQKIEKYLRQCSSVGLVIVADASRLSSVTSALETLEEQHFQSEFAFVLFYDRLQIKVASLKTRR